MSHQNIFNTIVRDHAERCATLIEMMKARLGDDFFGGQKGDVSFTLTPKLNSVVTYRGVMYWLSEDGELVAAVTNGGRTHYVHITEDGQWRTVVMPAADPALN